VVIGMQSTGGEWPWPSNYSPSLLCTCAWNVLDAGYELDHCLQLCVPEEACQSPNCPCLPMLHAN